MTEVETLQKRLADAEVAYDALMTGQQMVSGRHSVEQMQFQNIDPDRLQSYIMDLRGRLKALGVSVSGPTRIRARQVWH